MTSTPFFAKSCTAMSRNSWWDRGTFAAQRVLRLRFGRSAHDDDVIARGRAASGSGMHAVPAAGPCYSGSPSAAPLLRSVRFPHRKLPVRTDEVAGVALRDALQVILVLRLGFPEGTDRRHLGHDLSRP